MKKIIGYGVVYLVGLFCVYCMMLRVESLDKSNVNNLNSDNIYALNENK
jgi:hypothetical protein